MTMENKVTYDFLTPFSHVGWYIYSSICKDCTISIHSCQIILNELKQNYRKKSIKPFTVHLVMMLRKNQHRNPALVARSVCFLIVSEYVLSCYTCRSTVFFVGVRVNAEWMSHSFMLPVLPASTSCEEISNTHTHTQEEWQEMRDGGWKETIPPLQHSCSNLAESWVTVCVCFCVCASLAVLFVLWRGH